MQETTYALLDEEDILIDTAIAVKDDFETLNTIIQNHEAVSYREIDHEVYLIRPGLIYWNGNNWDRVSNKPN